MEHGLIRLPLLYIDLISPLVYLILLPCHISYITVIISQVNVAGCDNVLALVN